MKKRYSFLLLLMAGFIFKAQVPNPGFEILNPNGTIKNWGSDLLIAIAIDTSGNPIDSLVVDKGFYFSTSDAHSGTKALEMRNAYWHKTGDKLAGRARVTANDSDYINFAPAISYNQKPLNFTFYYKFFPAGADTAYALMTLWDSAGTQVAEAGVNITGTHTNYTHASVPIVYSSTTSAAFIEIKFITAKPYSEANYGTRFLVDDVMLQTPTTGLHIHGTTDHPLLAFPNPVGKEVHLRLHTASVPDHLQVRVINAEGKTVRNVPYELSGKLITLNTEGLASGAYFVYITCGSDTYSGKFTK